MCSALHVAKIKTFLNIDKCFCSIGKKLYLCKLKSNNKKTNKNGWFCNVFKSPAISVL